MKLATLSSRCGFAAACVLLAFTPKYVSAQQTTKEVIEGTTTITTEEISGTVEYVIGNNLVVRMSTGEVRLFTVDPTRKFIIDGKELTVYQIQPGTTLTRTTYNLTTPVTEITTTSGTGKVVWIVGNNLTVQLIPSNEVKQYKVPDGTRFKIDGNDNATLQDLRAGMTISAEKIVEVPKVDFVSNVVVTGHAPKK